MVINYLNNNISACMKLRKLLCLFISESAANSMFPNTYRGKNKSHSYVTK